jgi:hypothetical protein
MKVSKFLVSALVVVATTVSSMAQTAEEIAKNISKLLVEQRNGKPLKASKSRIVCR